MDLEIERRRNTDKHDWWKTLLSTISAVLIALVSWALATLREQEHRMTTVEVEQKALKSSTETFRDGIKEDIRELKADVKELLQRKGR